MFFLDLRMTTNKEKTPPNILIVNNPLVLAEQKNLRS